MQIACGSGSRQSDKLCYKLKRIQAIKTRMALEREKRLVIETYSTCHPVALSAQLEALHLAVMHDHADVREALFRGIQGVISGLDQFEQKWNTFSSVPFILSEFVEHEVRNRTSLGLQHDILPQELLDEMREAVREQITRSGTK